MILQRSRDDDDDDDNDDNDIFQWYTLCCPFSCMTMAIIVNTKANADIPFNIYILVLKHYAGKENSTRVQAYLDRTNPMHPASRRTSEPSLAHVLPSASPRRSTMLSFPNILAFGSRPAEGRDSTPDVHSIQKSPLAFSPQTTSDDLQL